MYFILILVTTVTTTCTVCQKISNRHDCFLLTGHFGHVYKGTMIQAGGRKMTVAVKTVKKYDSVQENSSFLCEMTIMSKLRHPNIIHLYGIVEQSGLN